MKSACGEGEAVASLAAANIDEGVSFRSTKFTNDEVDVSKNDLVGKTQSPPAVINSVKVSLPPRLSHGLSATPITRAERSAASGSSAG